MHTALPPRVENWRKRSAVGAILTGLAMGLREALEAERREPAIVVETSGDPPEDLAVEARLEGGPAKHNVVKIRPWLLPGADGGSEGGDSFESSAAGSASASASPSADGSAFPSDEGEVRRPGGAHFKRPEAPPAPGED